MNPSSLNLAPSRPAGGLSKVLRIVTAASLALVAACLCTTPAHAATTTYTSAWSGGTIAPGDTVVLNNGASVTGNVVANGTLQFNQSVGSLTVGNPNSVNILSGTGSLLLTNSGTLNLLGSVFTGSSLYSNAINLDMTTSASAGSLRILSGTGTLFVGYSGTIGALTVAGGNVSNSLGVLGYKAGTAGRAAVSSGTWANSGDLYVGYDGTGTLNVTGGSVTNQIGALGTNAGSKGMATVSGGTWASRSDLMVGWDGIGTLSVTGGVVTGSNGYVGYTAGSSGTATVSSGTWANGGNLHVGNSGTGTLNVTGGSVTNSWGYLGYNAGSVGTATVSSGAWANSSNLYVGFLGSGTGTLNVTGGSVTNNVGFLGYNAGCVGTATVSSGTWANSGYLYVGNIGTGTLNVTGGSVTNTNGYLGSAHGSVGTVTVSSGTWANSGDLTVGNSGTGTLNVTGGSVTNTNGVLGFNNRGNGTATVSSGTWANSGALNVGLNGAGTLYVTGGIVTNEQLLIGRYAGSMGTTTVSGGRVTNTDGYLGYNAGSVGTATVSSGTWANSDALFVGFSGTGTLNLTGGSVTDLSGVLGVNVGSVGKATVSGGTWANVNGLTVGNRGTGTLNVTGGSVTTPYGLLGSSAGGVGTATVSSGTLASSGNLVVGALGSGTLNVSGGIVTSRYGLLGGEGVYAAGSVGTATVSSGTWANSDGLYVGTGGTGALNVIGGSVTNTTGYLGYGAGSAGTAAVSTGTWATSGDLYVGYSGTGTLTMNGGLVTVGGTLSKGTYGTINLNSGGTLQIGVGSTGGVLLGGTGSLTNNGMLVFNRSDASTYSGIISGTGAVTKQGAGTLTLDGANAYTGLTTISAGTLQIGSGGTTGSITGNVVNNSSLVFNRSDSSTYSGIISGTGTLSLTNTGTLNLTGTSGAENTVVLDMTTSASSGGLQIRSGTGTLAVGYSGTGTLNVTGGSVTNSIGYLGYNAGSVGAATVSSGNWANSSDLYVGNSGTGTLNVTGGSVTNSIGYLGFVAGGIGTATVSSGTWANTQQLFIGSSGTGTLNVNGGSVTNSDGYIYARGTATITGGTWASSRNLYVGYSGTSRNGTLNVTGGVVTCENAFIGRNFRPPFGGGTVVGNGVATVSSGTWEIANNLFVGPSTAGSGSGVLTMTGGVVKVGGTLFNGVGTINLNAGGTLQIGTGGTTGVLGVSSLTNHGTLLFNRSDASTYSGIIIGTGAVTKQGTGTLALSGSNSYTGGTTLNAGSLVAGHLHAFGSGAVLVNSGTLNLDSHALANAITNSGGTIINAANYGGTQSVAGVVSMTGTVGGTVNVAAAGELKGSGVVFNGLVSLATGAQHSPGTSPGTQTFTSGLSYSAGSILNWELIANSGTGAGTNYDFLSVTGGSLVIESGAILDLVFSGSDSTVSWSDPFWDADRTWTIIDALAATSSTGEFTLGTISNDSLGQSLLSVRPDAAFSVGREGNNAVLTFTAVPEPSTYAMALACIAWAGWGAWRRRGQKRGGRSSIAVMMVPMAFAFGCSGAEGEILSFQVSGSMTTDSSSGGWSAGDPFTATYSFDNLAMGVYDSNIPATTYGTSVKSFVFDVAGKTYSMASNANGSISVGNDGFAGSDRYIVTGNTIQHPALADGLTVSFIQFDLIDWTGMALANESLVTSAAVLQGFGSKSGRFLLSNNDQPFFNISSITAVPEPSTWLMGLAGIACSGFSMWRRRKHQRVGHSFIIAASLPFVAAVIVTAGLIGGIAREAVGAPMVLVNNGSQILRFDATTGASLGNVLVDYGGGSIGGYTFGPDRNIYVSAFSGSRIDRFNGSTGAFMNTFATVTLSSPYQPLFGPDGNLYLGQSTGIITKYNGSTGQSLGIFISPPVGASDFGGMTFRGNSLYVSYLGQSGSLYRYDAATGGNAQLVYGGFFSNGPRAPVFDNAGTMYVPDWQTNKIFKFSETTLALTGTITTAFGIVPMSLAFDESGALLVLSDNGSQSQINRYNPATGAFIDTLVAPGTGGMGRASDMLFIVPEPTTSCMALAGLASGGYLMWRRRKRA